jgi:hypothetical protein
MWRVGAVLALNFFWQGLSPYGWLRGRARAAGVTCYTGYIYLVMRTN